MTGLGAQLREPPLAYSRGSGVRGERARLLLFISCHAERTFGRYGERSLDIAGPAGRVGGQERTREDWVAEATDDALRFVEEFVKWTQQNLGEVRVGYSPQSYIGVRHGRRVWAPLWLRSHGAMVYLLHPDGSREEQPSVAFDYFVDCLRAVGLEPAWQRTYNAGANPIALRLRLADLSKEPIQELLRVRFEILEAGSSPFSERNPVMAIGSEEAERRKLTPEPSEEDE